jgi:hypothetical protein
MGQQQLDKLEPRLIRQVLKICTGSIVILPVFAFNML